MRFLDPELDALFRPVVEAELEAPPSAVVGSLLALPSDRLIQVQEQLVGALAAGEYSYDRRALPVLVNAEDRAFHERHPVGQLVTLDGALEDECDSRRRAFGLEAVQ